MLHSVAFTTLRCIVRRGAAILYAAGGDGVVCALNQELLRRPSCGQQLHPFRVPTGFEFWVVPLVYPRYKRSAGGGLIRAFKGLSAKVKTPSLAGNVS